jgi:tetratricopeptide (TPR) repeat protein
MAQRLERALASSPTHTGLNHYLIHAVDAPRVASRAEASADRLGTLAPASPHLLHMPAHTYVRLGRWNDAVQVNIEALDADVRQERALKDQGFEPSPSWEGHNLHFLWYAALMDGRGDLALVQARRLANRAAQRDNATAEFMRALPTFTLARLERWTEVLAEPMPSSRSGIASAVAHQARGVALARLGRQQDARAEASALEALIESTALDGEKVFGVDPAREVLAVLRARLDAELLASQGAIEVALRALDQAVDREFALESAEPPLLAAGSRLARGDVAASRGRWADAEASYRDDLTEHPNSGWAWRGLARALAAQGRASDAAQAHEAWQRAWASADDRLRAQRMQ